MKWGKAIDSSFRRADQAVRDTIIQSEEPDRRQPAVEIRGMLAVCDFGQQPLDGQLCLWNSLQICACKSAKAEIDGSRAQRRPNSSKHSNYVYLSLLRAQQVRGDSSVS